MIPLWICAKESSTFHFAPCNWKLRTTSLKCHGIYLRQCGNRWYCFFAALVTLPQGQITIHVNTFTLTPSNEVLTWLISLSWPQSRWNTSNLDPVTTWHLLQDSTENVAFYASNIIKSTKLRDILENYWFPNPEDPGDPQYHTPIPRRILKELLNFQELEKPNPQDNPKSRRQFLTNFDWTDSMFRPHDIERIENLLVEFHDKFARHRFDRLEREIDGQLTPKDDSLAYRQSIPKPINLKEDILVELALLHRYGIITTLPFSKYASLIFAQKKRNGKLRLLIDLRKLNKSFRMTISTIITLSVHWLTLLNIWQAKIILQTRLFASLPLSANCGPNVHWNGSLQLCQQNICKPQISARP